MTKRDLLAALDAFDDDQIVYVCLFSRDEPHGSQVIIQGIASTYPWGPKTDDARRDLIGLVAHDRNSLLSTEGTPAFRTYQPARECVESETLRLKAARRDGGSRCPQCGGLPDAVSEHVGFTRNVLTFFCKRCGTYEVPRVNLATGAW